jgi:hypothetical protein
MTLPGSDVAPSRFSMGGVIGAALFLLRRNFWQYFAVALVLGIPLIVLSLARAVFMPAPNTSLSLSVVDTAGAGLSLLLAFVGVLTYFAIQSAINYGTLLDLRGERPAVGRCIARGVAMLPRVFVASLLLFLAIFALTFVAVLVSYGTAMGIMAATGQSPSIRAVSGAAGLVVLVITLFLFTNWWVFVPSIVAEGAGPVACFRRSRRLTQGHRWGILGIMALVFIANLGCSILLGAIGQFGVIATVALLNVVVALVFTALSAVLTAVGYYALRAEKEGFGLGDLARIFD